MNSNSKRAKKQVTEKILTTNFLSSEEIEIKIKQIEAELTSYTWRDLETHGKFDKNAKLTFITDEMLIVGCDIGSEAHYIRAIDAKGIELSKKAFCFGNNEAGFQEAMVWMLDLAAKNSKKQIVFGIEPTGHYWFSLTTWLISKGVSVVQVNPYAVKQSKEIEDNSQRKDDCKDPKIIANLVKNGNYGMPYLPERLYAELRRYTTLRDQLTEDRIRAINRLHREMKIYFPEYMDAFGKMDGSFALEVLKSAPIPSDIIEIGEEGLKDLWHKAKLRGRGYSRAAKIASYAETSVGLKDGESAGRTAIKWFTKQIIQLEKELSEIERILTEKCSELPNAEKIMEIKGVGRNILSGIVSELGDISRFDTAKEIQKLSGLGLVECSSGKHKGQTKISHRGRKRLRYWLFQAAKSAVAHADEFKKIHAYYTTRKDNPLKKMQSLIVIACKILRIVFTILKKGVKYDPKKMLKDIKLPENTSIALAA